MTSDPLPQRYTLLDRQGDRASWRFEGVNEDFVVDITLDPDGPVLDCPELFERL